MEPQLKKSASSWLGSRELSAYLPVHGSDWRVGHALLRSVLRLWVSMGNSSWSTSFGQHMVPWSISSRQHHQLHGSEIWHVFLWLAIRLRGSTLIRLRAWGVPLQPIVWCRIHFYLHHRPQLGGWVVTTMLWDISTNQLSHFLSCIFFRVNISISIHFQLVNILL
jgi:hypothetical protein